MEFMTAKAVDARLQVLESRLGEALAPAARILDLPVPLRPDGALRASLPRIRAARMETLRGLGELSTALNSNAVLAGQDPALAPQKMPAHAALTAAIMRLQSWQMRLIRIEPAIEGQIDPEPVPLRHDAPEPGTLEDAQTELWDRAFLALSALIKPEEQDQDSAAGGAFADIPLRPSLFLDLILAGYRTALAVRMTEKRPTFLDVGCGSGMKVVLAAGLFGRADGLERDPGYAATARTLFGALDLGSKLIEAEAMEFDGYGVYQVVYFFRPMRDDRIAELEARIVSQVRPGTVLLAPYASFADRAGDLGAREIDNSVWVAGITEEEGRLLAEVARKTGLRLPSRKPDAPIYNVFAEIRAALRVNGVEV